MSWRSWFRNFARVVPLGWEDKQVWRYLVHHWVSFGAPHSQTHLLKQWAAVTTQQLLISVAPHSRRVSRWKPFNRSEACHGQPPLRKKQRNNRCHTHGSSFPLFPPSLPHTGSAGVFKHHQWKCVIVVSICLGISRACREAGTSSGFPSDYRVVPERLVSTYDPFLATVKQAHPTHTRLWTCTAKLEQLGRYFQLWVSSVAVTEPNTFCLPWGH